MTEMAGHLTPPEGGRQGPGEEPTSSSVDGAPGPKLDGNGPVRAFRRTGTCERCGYQGGLDDGLCILCQVQIKIDEVVETPAWVAFELAKACVSCGREHDRMGELCGFCQREAS